MARAPNASSSPPPRHITFCDPSDDIEAAGGGHLAPGAARSERAPLSPCATPAMRPAERFVQRYQREHALPRGAKAAIRWAFAHPAQVRALQRALATVGAAAYAVGMVAAGPWAWLTTWVGIAGSSPCATRSKAGIGAACLLGGVMPTAVSAAIGGPVAAVATGLGSTLSAALLGGHLFEKLVAKVGCDTATYPYADRQYAGSRLYHIPDTTGGRPVPVLELNARTPWHAGIAHGYLLGAQIRTLVDNFQHALLGMPNYAASYPHTLAALKHVLQEDEKQEMQGMVLGFNAWAMEATVARRITFDEILGVQALPDMCHFLWSEAEANAQGRKSAPKAPAKPPVMGCTSVMLRGADGKITWGRNMDWAAFGMCGAMSLPIVWKNHASGYDYAVLGVPGLMGAVTGWNARGLSLAMHVIGGNTRDVAGVPASLYNRRVLREHASVADFADSRKTYQPLGPYHLLVADAAHGCCISFYQDAHREHHVRKLDQAPLWCLNWSYPGHRWDVFPSAQRHSDLHAYFGEAQEITRRSTSQDNATLIEGALQLASTNTLSTLHTLVFKDNSVSMRWSNGFAADQTPVEIPRDAVFGA